MAGSFRPPQMSEGLGLQDGGRAGGGTVSISPHLNGTQIGGMMGRGIQAGVGGFARPVPRNIDGPLVGGWTRPRALVTAS